MISRWTSPEGLKAIEKMGPVTWDASLDGSPHEATLTPPVIGTAWGGKCSCGLDDTLHQRVALALLRDHAREWLEKRNVRVVGWGNEKGNAYCIHKADTRMASAAWCRHPDFGERWEEYDEMACTPIGTEEILYYDFDEALVRAVTATEEKT